MKNQTTICVAIAFALAFAPIINAAPTPGGIPTSTSAANEQTCPELGCQNQPLISIHSAGNVVRGKTGSFVLVMKPALMLGGMYVNFKVSGTAVAGVDYVPLIAPAYIGQSGYATILVKTLRDPRAAASPQAYSVVVTLEPGAGYSLGSSATGASRSATIWIKPNATADW